jgi:hypothetical protein
MTDTATTSSIAVGPYTWSRYSANPVEHVCDTTMFRQPICGVHLTVGYQHIEDHPSGRAPLCERCQRKARRHTDVPTPHRRPA